MLSVNKLQTFYIHRYRKFEKFLATNFPMKDIDIFQFEYDNYCYNNVAIKWENIETLKKRFYNLLRSYHKILPTSQFYDFYIHGFMNQNFKES